MGQQCTAVTGLVLGTFLHALVGYDAQPSAAQLCSYRTVLIFIYAGTRLLQPRAVIR